MRSHLAGVRVLLLLGAAMNEPYLVLMSIAALTTVAGIASYYLIYVCVFP